MRLLIWILVLSLLSACDKDDAPAEPSAPTLPPLRMERPVSDALPELPAEPAEPTESAPPNIEIELEPVVDGDPAELPSARVPPAAKSPPTVARKKEVPVEEVKLPAPELDLSLPEEWTKELDLVQEAPNINLLPPLFDRENSRSVQMSGRLLPGLERDEAIDGAEINFELKR